MNLRLASTAGIVLLTLAIAPRVRASTDYPVVVQTYWNMRGKPLPVPGTKGCMLCHKDEIGGIGTATQPFGITLHQKFKVAGGNAASLRTGLAAVQTQRTNSDKDPVLDYTEIVVDGTNPNDPKSFVKPPPKPAPAGGQGGEGGEAGSAGANGEGGDGTSVADLGVPPATALPPPFTHGCSVGGQHSDALSELVALLGLGALSRRRRGTRVTER